MALAACAGFGFDRARPPGRRGGARADGSNDRSRRSRGSGAEDGQQHAGHARRVPECGVGRRPDRKQPGDAGWSACRLRTSSKSTCACTRSRCIWAAAARSTGLSNTVTEPSNGKNNTTYCSTTRRHGGTGLGLAISKELVKLMGAPLRPADWYRLDILVYPPAALCKTIDRQRTASRRISRRSSADRGR